MNISPYKNKPSNVPHDTGTDQPVVSECGKRIFFVTGERDCGKSTFLAALMKKYAIRPSGFITKKEAPPECAVYMHQVIDGTARYRYTTGNKVGICPRQKPVGFAPVFDAYGVMCLKQAETAVRPSLGGEHYDISYGTTPPQQHLPIILMDELGVMETKAEFFFRTVCALFADSRYYIIGAVKPRGTRFLPVLEQIPEAIVYRLTPQNRPQLYDQLEQAQSFVAFLHAVSSGSPNGKK